MASVDVPRLELDPDSSTLRPHFRLLWVRSVLADIGRRTCSPGHIHACIVRPWLHPCLPCDYRVPRELHPLIKMRHQKEPELLFSEPVYCVSLTSPTPPLYLKKKFFFK